MSIFRVGEKVQKSYIRLHNIKRSWIHFTFKEPFYKKIDVFFFRTS